MGAGSQLVQARQWRIAGNQESAHRFGTPRYGCSGERLPRGLKPGSFAWALGKTLKAARTLIWNQQIRDGKGDSVIEVPAFPLPAVNATYLIAATSSQAGNESLFRLRVHRSILLSSIACW